MKLSMTAIKILSGITWPGLLALWVALDTPVPEVDFTLHFAIGQKAAISITRPETVTMLRAE